jgi:oligopeptide/dipeptide ABC transporter ATP-binding protein
VDGGSIRFGGEEISTLGGARFRPLRKRIQMVFQDPYDSLDPRLCVADIVGDALALAGVPRRQRRERVTDLLGQVQLGPQHLSRRPGELAGGQRQRVGIARALAVDPELIVLDEPTSSLDLSVRAEIVELLEQIQREREVAYLFISHDLLTVRHVSRRVAVMYQGQIVEQGPTDSVIEAPAHPYTIALLSSVLMPDPNRRHLRAATAAESGEPAGGEPDAQPRSDEVWRAGCVFRDRCALAVPECGDGRPAPREAGPGHAAACLRAGDARRLAQEAAIAQQLAPVTIGHLSARPAATAAEGRTDAP